MQSKFGILLAVAAGLFAVALVILMSNVDAATNMPVSSIILGYSIAGGLALVAAGLVGARKE